MSQIRHVRLTLPDPITLQRLLREAGAAAFPTWLGIDIGPDPRVAWWGVSDLADALRSPPRSVPDGLFPRRFEDGTDVPRALVLATVDADRAADELAPLIDDSWRDVGADPVLGAQCRSSRVGVSRLVLAEPTTEGYAAACLARFGEGPIAVALGATTAPGEGRRGSVNPVDEGPATYLRLGRGTAPTLILLQAS